MIKIKEDGRTCTRCLDFFNWDYFGKDCKGSNGKKFICRPCQYAFEKETRKKNKNYPKTIRIHKRYQGEDQPGEPIYAIYYDKDGNKTVLGSLK